MVQVVSRQTNHRPVSSPGQICGEHSYIGSGFYMRVLQLFPVSITPSMVRTHLHHAALTRRTNGRSLGTFQNANALS